MNFVDRDRHAGKNVCGINRLDCLHDSSILLQSPTQSQVATLDSSRLVSMCQFRAIFVIARGQRVDPTTVVRERCNVERLEDLSIREASTLIDELKRGAVELRSQLRSYRHRSGTTSAIESNSVRPSLSGPIPPSSASVAAIAASVQRVEVGAKP